MANASAAGVGQGPRITRRACLAALPVSVPTAFAASRPHASLRDASASRGLVFGAFPYDYPPTRDQALDRLVGEQCALVAPILHWSIVSPKPGDFDGFADRGVCALAAAHGLQLGGAHLLWHEKYPRWFAELPDANAARAAIARHIRRMGERYGRETWFINVVNECLDPKGGRPDGLRMDPALRAIGPSYLELAFHEAREAFPSSRLVLNDYGMEQDVGDMAAKRRAFLALLDGFRRRGVPVDAVGLQSHLALSKTFDEVSYLAFLREIAARGVRIILSELDVLDVGAPGDEARRDLEVAAMYRRFLTAALSERAVSCVMIWGLSDRHTWLTPRQNRKFARADGLPTRPLPFDAQLHPKPAFHSILESFLAAPRRPMDVRVTRG
jgi:endo-1,4-beta-xylanase